MDIWEHANLAVFEGLEQQEGGCAEGSYITALCYTQSSFNCPAISSRKVLRLGFAELAEGVVRLLA